MLKRKNIIWIVTILAVVALWGFKKGEERTFLLSKNLDVFNAIVKELDLFYVDTLQVEKTIREGIDNMLYSLDPYTIYYPESDQDELEMMIRGSYGGIGSVIRYLPKEKYTVIAEPYEGMPAAVQGLKTGDLLLEIDGKDLKGNTDVSKLLRGQVGTSFEVKVKRPGEKKPLNFTITRKSIQLPTIPYADIVVDSIGYINLSSFSGTPARDFKQTFMHLKEEGMKSLIIDLRGNGGGLLDQAVDIVNFFVPRGKTIVTTKGKISQACSVYKTKREPLDLDMPIVVLVGGGTASSSEILSGSLQDLDRAVIVGTRTFGKGLVQATRPLPYGGNLKLTTSKYYIPSGRCVQAIDYAKRNEDGSVARIPDSLTTVFHTEMGREVRDGGGVTPDVEITPEKLPHILFYLVNENLIFDYATDYCLTHPKLESPKTFKLSDADYIAFKDKVKASGFKYDQQSDAILKKLKEAAEFEGYLEGASAEFEALENKLQHDLDRDLDYFAKDIKPMISTEIVKRYFYQEGGIIEGLKNDKVLNEAIDILHTGHYKEILKKK